RARLTQAVKREALLVPQRGVTRNQRGEAVVLVVDGNVVAERVVTAERVIGNEWLITAGLSPGDRVILDGLQKVRPGVEVQAVEVASRPATAVLASETPSAPAGSGQ